MNKTNVFERISTFFFFMTGIFAIIGALYAWGDGFLFDQKNLSIVLIPLADLLVTGPLSLLAAYGIGSKKDWGHIIGLMVCGIYLFGSALVYIILIWNGAPYPLQLVIPPIFGISFSIAYSLRFLLSPSTNRPKNRLYSLEVPIPAIQIQSIQKQSQ
jgi:hypothetical protein